MKSTMNFQTKKNLTGSQGFGNNAKRSTIGALKSSNAEILSGSVANLQQSAKKATLMKSNVSTFKNTNGGNNTKTGMLKEPESLIKSKEMIKRVVLNDSEDRWFLNPQFKIEMKPTTKLIITLLQADEKISKIPYQKCNFMILMSRVNFLIFSKHKIL